MDLAVGLIPADAVAPDRQRRHDLEHGRLDRWAIVAAITDIEHETRG